MGLVLQIKCDNMPILKQTNNRRIDTNADKS